MKNECESCKVADSGNTSPCSTCENNKNYMEVDIPRELVLFLLAILCAVLIVGTTYAFLFLSRLW